MRKNLAAPEIGVFSIPPQYLGSSMFPGFGVFAAPKKEAMIWIRGVAYPYGRNLFLAVGSLVAASWLSQTLDSCSLMTFARWMPLQLEVMGKKYESVKMLGVFSPSG